jgi:lipopolysaccharide export system permease protein
MSDTLGVEKKIVLSRKKWALFPILDRYVLIEFLIPFFVLLIGFIILFLIGDIFDDLRDFLENEAPFERMMTYFLLKLPGNIRFILPISVLLGCMYEMANFGKNMEIVAMRASGLSIHRACASIYFMAFLIAILNFWFNETIVPRAEKQAYEILKKTNNEHYDPSQFSMLTYKSPDNLRTWFFRHFDSDGKQYSVILKKYNEKTGALEWDIEAEEAVFTPKEGWTFFNGGYTPYIKDGFLPKKTGKFDKMEINLEDVPESPERIYHSVQPSTDLPSIVILDLLTSTKNMAATCKNIYKTTIYYRIAFPWASLLAVFLAIPLAAKNHRGGIFISIIVAVGIIVVYQISSHLFIIFGNRGILPPFIAGLFPTAAFIIYGIISTSKNN